LSSDSVNVTEEGQTDLETNPSSINEVNDQQSEPEITTIEAIEGKCEDQISPQSEEEISSTDSGVEAKPLSNAFIILTPSAFD